MKQKQKSYKMRDVFNKMQEGKTFSGACYALGLEPRFVMKKVNEFPEFQKSLDAAYKVSADMQMEGVQRAIDNFDEEKHGKSGASVLQTHMKHAHRMASAFNKELYGENKNAGMVTLPTVTFNIGHLTNVTNAVAIPKNVIDISSELPILSVHNGE